MRTVVIQARWWRQCWAALTAPQYKALLVVGLKHMRPPSARVARALLTNLLALQGRVADNRTRGQPPDRAALQEGLIEMSSTAGMPLVKKPQLMPVQLLSVCKCLALSSAEVAVEMHRVLLAVDEVMARAAGGMHMTASDRQNVELLLDFILVSA
jgi:hypothetical protein